MVGREVPRGDGSSPGLTASPVPASGGAGRMYMFPPDFEGLCAGKHLRSCPSIAAKGGAGGALLARISQVARDAGKTKLVGRTTSDRRMPSLSSSTAGSREGERMKVVRLELAGL